MQRNYAKRFLIVVFETSICYWNQSRDSCKGKTTEQEIECAHAAVLYGMCNEQTSKINEKENHHIP